MAVLIANGTLLLVQGRFSRLMGVTHLLPWGALQFYLIAGLIAQQWHGWLFVYVAILLVVNSISLAFDIPDSIKSLKGEPNFS